MSEAAVIDEGAFIISGHFRCVCVGSAARAFPSIVAALLPTSRARQPPATPRLPVSSREAAASLL